MASDLSWDHYRRKRVGASLPRPKEFALWGGRRLSMLQWYVQWSVIRPTMLAMHWRSGPADPCSTVQIEISNPELFAGLTFKFFARAFWTSCSWSLYNAAERVHWRYVSKI
jgi:hypothetical protein